MTEFEQEVLNHQRQQVRLINYGPRGVSFCMSDLPLSVDNPLMFYCSSCVVEYNCRNILVGLDTAHKKGCKNLLMNKLGM
jgi:hypothetical protein